MIRFQKANKNINVNLIENKWFDRECREIKCS